MNKIVRNIYVKRMTLRERISYVQGTNAIGFQFDFKDFEIPEGAESFVYVDRPDGTAEFDRAAITDNSVIVDVKSSMFPIVGNSILQIRIDKDKKTLVTFAVTVNVVKNHANTGEGSRNVTDILKDVIAEAAKQAERAGEQAKYAKEQGDYAKMQAQYAKEQGNYAKEQGDNADSAAKECIKATVVCKDATKASQIQTTECKIATEAAKEAATGHSIIYDPSDGERETIQDTVNHMWVELVKMFGSPLTAGEYDSKSLTAGTYDSKNLTANEYDTRGGAMLK